MASERPARPGASSLPGLRNSALASAALTSVALLAQTANAAPQPGDEAPSREEISRRVSSLYDQAESDTGTFNATRASSTGPRQRADRPAEGGRGAAGAGGGDGRRGDSTLDGVARQWFDMARAKLGPTVPAALPRQAAPVRPAAPRSARPATGVGGTRGETAGAAAELAAGGDLRSPRPELAAGPAAAPRTPSGGQSASTALALPAQAADPGREQSSLRSGKERNQGKLARARALMSAHTAARSNPVAAIAAPSVTDTWGGAPATAQPPAGPPWQAPEAQSAADLITRGAEPVSWAAPQAPAADAYPRADPLTGTGAFPVAGPLTSTGTFPSVNPLTGAYPAPDPLTATGTFTRTDPPTNTGTYPATDPLSGTGAFPAADPLGGTGGYPAQGPLTATGTFPAADPLTGAGSLPTADPVSGTGAFPAADPVSGTGGFPAADPVGTGSFPPPDPLTGTGSFPSADPFTGTGAFAVPGALAASGTYAAVPAPRDTRAVRALEFARAQLGKPCVWGTSGPGSYDGPGLTRAAYKAAGITLPRTAPEQATAGQGVALDRLEPGDLVLFHVGHVGIYSGGGLMIHAPGPGAAIREESVHYAGEAALHSAIRPA
ncbi:NLP/P60-family protein [Streptomyces zinciresistens K42]|uniref:NLP/P60-family protein n=1 Tax=Streptomyces zinciresistens K42 TaxID=700597 RepID=G2G8Z9_9ACTN|nr:NLP/P60-family protein [Streptomyces zinciresistens K42]